jgi:2-keto-3-deoxy-L-rhamnonate aldolase RhmA
MIAAARGAGISVVVRIPEIRRETIMKPLDSGADGLLVPMVNTAGEAKEVVKFAKYPPLGQRGVALSRAHSRYGRPKADEYLDQANQATFIAVQAETVQAIDHLEVIASTAGVDSIFVGPFDLSVSMGIPGQVTDSREEEAIARVIEVCQKHEIIPGIHMSSVDSLKEWIGRGMRFVSFSSDVDLLARAARESLVELRKSGEK